ncbi:hypothetical protein Pla100_16610 [Neorhodopirellula pilleata]|uniref:Uncharacterized protein n=1 Tax=Neorhodopirellula pilleata TaxID=2714738 RepID=A0A5C6APK9_9BACT|nr:hypothetical protein Pla100_16610 [Neorhodopirellula pilleata]
MNPSLTLRVTIQSTCPHAHRLIGVCGYWLGAQKKTPDRKIARFVLIDSVS